jgi:hypothetical protein
MPEGESKIVFACGWIVQLNKKGSGGTSVGDVKRRLHVKKCDICKKNSGGTYILTVDSRRANRKYNVIENKALQQVTIAHHDKYTDMI